MCKETLADARWTPTFMVDGEDGLHLCRKKFFIENGKMKVLGWFRSEHAYRRAEDGDTVSDDDVKTSAPGCTNYSETIRWVPIR